MHIDGRWRGSGNPKCETLNPKQARITETPNRQAILSQSCEERQGHEEKTSHGARATGHGSGTADERRCTRMWEYVIPLKAGIQALSTANHANSAKSSIIIHQ